MAKEYSELVEENEELQQVNADLLEACKSAFKYFMDEREHFVDVDKVEPIEQLLQQAINKAEGK